MEEINPGSTVIMDGQVSRSLQVNDRTVITRTAAPLRLVRNPLYPSWNRLITKLRWGQSPE